MSGSTLRSSRSRPQTTNVDPAKLPTEVLRLRLQQANLLTTGRRPQLVKRLADHLGQSASSTQTQHRVSRPPTPSAENPESQSSEEPSVASDSEPSADDPSSSDSNIIHPPRVTARHRSSGRSRRRHSSPKSSDLDSSSEADVSSGSDDSSDSATTISDSERAWRRSRHRLQRSSRHHHHHQSPPRTDRTRHRRPSDRRLHYSPRSRSRSRSRRRPSHTQRHHHRSDQRRHLHTHRRGSPIHRRHHRSHSPTYSCYHRHRSVLDRLGPTPSPSPSDSNDTFFSDDIPPSSCGQPLRPSLLRRIRRGEYVNFAHLLPSPPGVDPDHSRYTRRSRSPSPARGGSHTREPQIPLPKITNIDSWLRAWTRYLLAVTHYGPAKAVQMIKYQDRIITAAERFSVDGWYSYDKAFRLKLSHDPSLRWDHLDGDLWAFWCAAQARPFCSRCHRYGHLQAARPVGKSFRPNNKTKDGRIICLRFNHNTCTNPSKCRYAHVCLKCEGGHPSSACTGDRNT